MTTVTAEEVRAFVLEDLAEPLAEVGLLPEQVRDDLDLLSSGVIDSLGLIELTVGAVVSMTMFLALPSEPSAPGLASVNTALFPAVSLIVPPFRVRAALEI